MKTELIEKLKKIIIEQKCVADKSTILEAITALEKQDSERVSAEEVLLKIANENSYESWADFVCDSHDHTILEYTIQAMHDYAGKSDAVITKEQFIKVADWIDKLTHRDRVSVWSKNGESQGLFNMDNEQLYEKYQAFLNREEANNG